MPTRRWFQLSLLLPIAVPVLLWPFVTAKGAFQALSWVAVGSLVVGGVPYVPFALYVTRAMDRAEQRRVIELAWLAPLAFAPVEALFVALALGVTSVGRGDALRTAAAGLAAGAFFAAWVLVVGYVYVILATLGYGLFTRVGLIDDPTPERPVAVRWGRDVPRPA